jgi:4-amino-4-deoxy-L-arabinose transferase-like glycosyltransferase
MVQSLSHNRAAAPGDSAGTRWGPSWIGGAILAGLAARVAAGLVVEIAARRQGTLCLFADTNIYWHLAGALRDGEPYVVSQYGMPHFAIRTPGYPLFLAAVSTFFGATTLTARIAQAGLGALCVWAVARLVDRLVGGAERAGHPCRAAVWAAWIVALEPYTVGMSALLLSEALFVPLMLLGLIGIAALSDPGTTGRLSGGQSVALALATGAVHGAAILVRPSWAIAPPLLLLACVALAVPARRLALLRSAALVAIGIAIVMAPWWARNARIYGRFVPTSLWLGATLYDGLNPQADGSSDMRFLDAPEIRVLDEPAQDRALRALALEFSRNHPLRVAELALAKAARFWSPWPQAEGFASVPVSIASALIVIPTYVLIMMGAWRRRHDTRILLILLGPLLLFAALHFVFVGSIRYRVPVQVPALGLAGFALAALSSPRPGEGRMSRDG